MIYEWGWSLKGLYNRLSSEIRIEAIFNPLIQVGHNEVATELKMAAKRWYHLHYSTMLLGPCRPLFRSLVSLSHYV